ncbi:MAG: hypothetical protein JRH19_01555 [Deltaproteobacteria bacterium]|nr:hypothetical protein [Deltaproteobacteria bacterium]
MTMKALYDIDHGTSIEITTAYSAVADETVAPRASASRTGFLAGGLEWMPLERTAGLDPLDLWITLHDQRERGLSEGWRFAERSEVEALISTFCDQPEGRAELLGMLGLVRGSVDRDGTVHRELEAWFTEDPMREIGLGLVKGEVVTRGGRLVESRFESCDPWMSETEAKTAAVLVVRDEHWTALSGEPAGKDVDAHAELESSWGC